MCHVPLEKHEPVHAPHVGNSPAPHVIDRPFAHVPIVPALEQGQPGTGVVLLHMVGIVEPPPSGPQYAEPTSAVPPSGSGDRYAS
jgi:hypothetical protein